VSIPSALVRTERGLDRLITLLDAVVAIAITLLVLPLVDLLAEGRHDDLAGLLGDHLSELSAFALSFMVIARLWLVHHQIGEWAGSYDRLFVWVNLFWGLTIVVLPFSTQVVADFPSQRLVTVLYVGTIAASAVATAALTWLVARRPALRREEVRAVDVDVRHAVVAAGLLVAALLVGVALPRLGEAPLLLLLLSGPVERLVGRFRSAEVTHE